MKVYGAQICTDCRNYKAIQKSRGFEAEYVDITEDTGKLKEFLQIRDHDPVLAPVKNAEESGFRCLSMRTDKRLWISMRRFPGSDSRRCSRKKLWRNILPAELMDVIDGNPVSGF